MFNEENQIHNFMSSSGSGPVINYGSGSDFFTSYGSGSTSQKVTVPTVPVPKHCGGMLLLLGTPICGIRMFLGLPDPDPLERGTDPVKDPDSSIIKKKIRKTFIPPVL